MKMNPTDLHDMNTQSFSPNTFSSKMPQGNAMMSPNKFNNKSVLSNAGLNQLDIREDLRDIQEESMADNRSSLSNELQMAKLNNQNAERNHFSPGTLMATTGKLEQSIGKNSVVDSDVDGLIRWAKDLPDDISINAGQSFYQSMLRNTQSKQNI